MEFLARPGVEPEAIIEIQHLEIDSHIGARVEEIGVGGLRARMDDQRADHHH